MKKRIFAQIAALVVAFTVLSGCGINVGNSGFGSYPCFKRLPPITLKR